MACLNFGQSAKAPLLRLFGEPSLTYT